MATTSEVENRIEQALQGKSESLRETVQALRELVKKLVPDATETVNSWNIPTFEYNGPLCYYSVASKHITFGFLQGAHLEDPTGLLEGTGKNLRHVKLKRVEDVHNKSLAALIKSAAKANKLEPTTMMGRKVSEGTASRKTISKKSTKVKQTVKNNRL